MAHQPAVENMVELFGDIYRGKRVLVTGHTGFKGSWLSLWLRELGAQVSGIALPPNTTPNHWDALQLDIDAHTQDIRDGDALRALIETIQPEMIFHLAAQPLVRASYAQPVENWATNVMGTVHVLDACRNLKSLKAVCVVTSDKCYENRETSTPYRETDRLGGHDPYSASKAATELVAASYRASFFHEDHAALIATARAGNVIGGGDWSADRLIPDIARAIAKGEPLTIRNPNATRPWQHVLESLSGYLLLGQRLFEGDKNAAQAWNFGPAALDHASVGMLLETIGTRLPDFRWTVDGSTQPHEAGLLALNSQKAHHELGWKPVWSLTQALNATADWYRHFRVDRTVESRMQLQAYIAAAQAAQVPWSMA